MKKSLDSIRTISEDWKRIDAYHEWMKGLELEIFSLKSKVEKLTAPNSDYAAALKALDDYHNVTDLKEAIMPFSEWCRARLNATKKA